MPVTRITYTEEDDIHEGGGGQKSPWEQENSRVHRVEIEDEKRRHRDISKIKTKREETKGRKGESERNHVEKEEREEISVSFVSMQYSGFFISLSILYVQCIK